MFTASPDQVPRNKALLTQQTHRQHVALSQGSTTSTLPTLASTSDDVHRRVLLVYALMPVCCHSSERLFQFLAKWQAICSRFNNRASRFQCNLSGERDIKFKSNFKVFQRGLKARVNKCLVLQKRNLQSTGRISGLNTRFSSILGWCVYSLKIAKTANREKL